MEYLFVEQQIDWFEKQLHGDAPLTGDDFAEMWGLVKVIGAGFKAHRWETRERKDEQWARHQALVEELKIKNDVYRVAYNETKAAKNAAWEAKNLSSQTLANQIIAQAQQAHPDRKVVSDNLQDPAVLQPLKYRSQLLTEARQAYNTHRPDILREDGERIRAAFDAVSVALGAAWDTHKKEQELAYKQRESDRKKRNEEWEKKQYDFLQVLIEKCSRKQNILSIMNTELNDLDDKLISAQSDTFKENVTGWIADKKDRIAATKAEIEKLNLKIAELKKQFEGEE